jgi:hypothetical protein
MFQTRRGLYAILFLLTLLGWSWIFIRAYNRSVSELNVCFLKSTTGLACPACGTTRSIEAILNGNPVEGVLINPFGYIVITIMIVAPIWILRDWFLSSASFFTFYKKIESSFKRPFLVWLLGFLVVVNWIWNFYKGF